MYRKLIFILVFIICLLNAGRQAYCQYYYSDNRQVSLSVDTTRLLVLFDDGYTYNWDDFLNDHPQIDSQILAGVDLEEFYFFAVTTDNYNELIDSLIIDARVAKVNPYFMISQNKARLIGRTICCKFNENVSIDFIDSLNEVHDVEIVYEREYTPNQFLLQVDKDASLSTLEIANLYYNLDETEFCHPNFLGGFEYTEYIISDYYWDEQWAMHRIFESSPQSPRHKALEITAGDSNIIIAVIDQGLSPHEDLPEERLTAGYDFERMDNDPTPCDLPNWGWHGIGVAGIVAASHNGDSTDPNSGIYGVVSNCKIMPLKIGSGIPIDSQHVPDTGFTDNCWGWFASDERISGAIAWAWTHEADIISCSWSSSEPSDVVSCAIRQASTLGRDGKGCCIFFASGNNSYDDTTYFGCMDEVISVGALHPDDSVWDYSGYNKVDVVAPSGKSNDNPIWTLDLMGSLGWNYQGAGCLDPGDLDYNCIFGGTSAAQPVVAGVAALVLSKYPDLTREELYQVIKCSADRNLYDTIASPPMQKYGYGMVHPLRALLTVSRGDSNNDGIINIFDISYIVSYLYLGGPPPTPDILMSDANCDGIVNLFDATYLQTWLYLEGEPPPVPCCDFED